MGFLLPFCGCPNNTGPATWLIFGPPVSSKLSKGRPLRALTGSSILNSRCGAALGRFPADAWSHWNQTRHHEISFRNQTPRVQVPLCYKYKYRGFHVKDRKHLYIHIYICICTSLSLYIYIYTRMCMHIYRSRSHTMVIPLGASIALHGYMDGFYGRCRCRRRCGRQNCFS